MSERYTPFQSEEDITGEAIEAIAPFDRNSTESEEEIDFLIHEVEQEEHYKFTFHI